MHRLHISPENLNKKQLCIIIKFLELNDFLSEIKPISPKN